MNECYDHVLHSLQIQLRQSEEERQKLQILVKEQQSEAANLRDALANMNETVQDLKTENIQLQSSLSQHRLVTLPTSRLCSSVHAVSI